MQLQEKRKLSVRQQCLKPNTIYEAHISNNTNYEHKKYLGATETSFKERYSNHTRDFKHKKHMKCTELSKYIWNLKNQNIALIVKWRIVQKFNSKVSSNYCKLCLTEKLFIIKSLDDLQFINSKV